MKIKGDCGCRGAGKEINQSRLNDFVFCQIQLANTNKKERAIIVEAEQVSGLDFNTAIFLRKEIIARVKVGLKNISDVKFSRQIL